MGFLGFLGFFGVLGGFESAAGRSGRTLSFGFISYQTFVGVNVNDDVNNNLMIIDLKLDVGMVM